MKNKVKLSEPPAQPSTDTVPDGTVTRAEFLNLFAAVFLPMFLAAVDQTLLATATPAIAATLGGLSDTSWIAVAYLLSSAALVPVYGRLGDLRGRRNMLMVAVVIFSLGSLACGIAQSLPQLVAARVMQGLGGAGLMTLSQALVGELVAPRERVRFQAYFAAMFTTASVSGPILGGIVVSHFSWRWLFLVNLPLAAFAMWRLSKLPPGEPHPEQSGLHDFAGIILFALSAVSGLYWLTSAGHHFPWVSTPSALLVALALITLGTLVWHERRHASPFLPTDLLQQKAIAFPLITTALFASCMFAMVFFLPIYLQLGHHFTALRSGLLLLPLTVGLVMGSMISGRFVSRTGQARLVPVYGMSLSSLALLLLGVLPSNTVLVGVLGFVAGLGFGTVMPTTQIVVQTVAGRARLGAVTSMVSLSRSIGGACGATVFGALVFALMPTIDVRALAQVATEAPTPSVTHAFHVAFIVAALVAAVAAYAASRVPKVTLWQPRAAASDKADTQLPD